MCSEAPDRADVRSRLVDSILGLLEGLQKVAPDLGPRFLKFLAKLLRSAKVCMYVFMTRRRLSRYEMHVLSLFYAL